MGFGVTDLFGMIAGGAWLTKEAIKENLELSGNRAQAQQVLAYIEEHTDVELEKRLREELLSPACYDSVWRRIETYKRDNPLWCRQHETAAWQGQYTGTEYQPLFGWQDVGKKRLPFWDESASPDSAASKEAAASFNTNRGIALSLLMQTYGKTPLAIAQIEAERKYPPPKSKHA